ncbi:MAG: lysophospholipase, partial [Mariprofundus sp.]|nr:lysophospholipase [Mariprofundus sp.]
AAPFFTRHGIAVYAYDQRGFGRSANRGRWPGKDIFAQDAQTFAHLLRTQFPHTPLFLLGHSMGAAVAVHALASTPMDVDGIILAAPAISGWSTMPWWQRWGLKLAAHTIPWNTFTGQSLHITASDNRKMLIALGRDRLVIKETRVDTIYGLVNLMEAAYRSASALHAPALILYGEKDEVIAKAPVLETFGPLARNNADIRLQIYKNGYHMLLRDLQAEVVWRDITSWIHQHHAPLPSQQQGLSKPG